MRIFIIILLLHFQHLANGQFGFEVYMVNTHNSNLLSNMPTFQDENFGTSFGLKLFYNKMMGLDNFFTLSVGRERKETSSTFITSRTASFSVANNDLPLFQEEGFELNTIILGLGYNRKILKSFALGLHLDFEYLSDSKIIENIYYHKRSLSSIRRYSFDALDAEFNNFFLSPNIDFDLFLGERIRIFGRYKIPLYWQNLDNNKIFSNKVRLHSFLIGTKIMFSPIASLDSKDALSKNNISKKNPSRNQKQKATKKWSVSTSLDVGAISNVTKIIDDAYMGILPLQNIGLNIQSLISFGMGINFKNKDNSGRGIDLLFSQHFDGFGVFLNEELDKNGITSSSESTFVNSLSIQPKIFKSIKFLKNRFLFRSSIGAGLELYPGSRKGFLSSGSGRTDIDGVKFVSYEEITNMVSPINFKINGKLEFGINIDSHIAVLFNIAYSQGLIRIAETAIDYAYPVNNIESSATSISKNSFYRLGAGLSYSFN